MSGLDDEMEKVRAKQRAAMGAQASQGSTREGVLEAGLRAALDHAVAGLAPDLARLREALGDEDIDPGSLMLGGLAVSLVIQGVDVLEVGRAYAPLLREYMAKARELDL
jgi:hypothetical protein